MTTTKQRNILVKRRDFPVLKTRIYGKPLVYFDNASTTQKPFDVINSMIDFYAGYNSNVHRGVHTLSQIATDAFEASRRVVKDFIKAPLVDEIIFTKGATEAINLVAATFGEVQVKHGDNIVVTMMEHHANYVPWQQLCRRKGAEFRVAPLKKDGTLNMTALAKLLDKKTRLLAVTHTSNSIGTINPIKEIVALAHKKHVPVLVDGCQAIQHLPVNVKALDVDFYVFSGHKVYGPTGIGVLYGKFDLLQVMPPYQTGGEMVRVVTQKKTTFNNAPSRFEAGTPPIAQAIGLAAALRYIEGVGIQNIKKYETALTRYAMKALKKIGGVTVYGPDKNHGAIISFSVEGIHPHDLGTIFDLEGIAIRTGHHCAQPVMAYFDIPATARISLAAYNTFSEVDHLIQKIIKAKKLMHV